MAERGKDLGIDAAEVFVFASARIGELTRDMEGAGKGKAPGAGKGHGKLSARKLSKKAQLEAEGLTEKQAAQCEQLAEAAAAGALGDYVDECRAAGLAPTISNEVVDVRRGVLATIQVLARVEGKHERATDSGPPQAGD